MSTVMVDEFIFWVFCCLLLENISFTFTICSIFYTFLKLVAFWSCKLNLGDWYIQTTSRGSLEPHPNTPSNYYVACYFSQSTSSRPHPNLFKSPGSQDTGNFSCHASPFVELHWRRRFLHNDSAQVDNQSQGKEDLYRLQEYNAKCNEWHANCTDLIISSNQVWGASMSTCVQKLRQTSSRIVTSPKHSAMCHPRIICFANWARTIHVTWPWWWSTPILWNETVG